MFLGSDWKFMGPRHATQRQEIKETAGEERGENQQNDQRSDLVQTRAQVRNVMVFFMPTASLGLY